MQIAFDTLGCALKLPRARQGGYTVVVADKGDRRVRAIGPTTDGDWRRLGPTYDAAAAKHDFVAVVRWDDRDLTVRAIRARLRKLAQCYG